MDNREIIQRSIDYIEENLRTEITAEELAEQVGFSKFHYYRLFQSQTGMPVMQYILRRRLLHAIYAAGQGSRRINAALEYGFDTYAGFYKAFCREFGCTPSEFLRTCRAKRPYRIMLAKEEHIMMTHKRAARLLRCWGLEEETVSQIFRDSTGSPLSNACYVGDAYVLKFTPNLGKAQKNLALSKAIHAAGLLAATPVKTTDGREYVQEGELYCYVQRRLPGKTMSAGRAAAGDYGESAFFMGESIGRLHQALALTEDEVEEADLLRTVSTWALPKAQTVLGLSDGFCKDFLKTFGALYERLPRQLIHRDPNPGNMLVTEDGWGFIDFELSERNVRVFDPCYAATAVLSECFGKGNDTWLQVLRDIIRGYDAVQHLTEAEREAIPYVILANQMVCIAWFSEQEQYRELLETNRKMTLWLLEHFAELSRAPFAK